jgi:hypothetical protein
MVGQPGAGKSLLAARPGEISLAHHGACSSSTNARGLSLLREATDAMRLSARGHHRVLRVARTLADLDGADKKARVQSPKRCPTGRWPTKCGALSIFAS